MVFIEACVAMEVSELSEVDRDEELRICCDGRLQRNGLSKFRVKRLERLKSWRRGALSRVLIRACKAWSLNLELCAAKSYRIIGLRLSTY